jgi:hypothetical protein
MNSAGSRMERDTFGEIAVPNDKLWGAQTQRSLHHFHISTEKQSPELINALALVKKVLREGERRNGSSLCTPKLVIGDSDFAKCVALHAGACGIYCVCHVKFVTDPHPLSNL